MLHAGILMSVILPSMVIGGADARQRTGRGEGKRPRMSKVHGRKIAN